MSRSDGGPSSRVQPLKGRFLDGVWHCDCDPRLPGVHLQSGKQNQNLGKWFYRCQKPMKQQCSFFLWESDANVREEGALKNNSRTEIAAANPATPAKRPPAPLPSSTTMTAPSSSNHKRKRPVDRDNEYGLDQVDEDILNEVMSQIGTLSKPAKTTDLSTPVTKRRNFPWNTNQGSTMGVQGLQTPQTERKAPGNPFTSRTPVTSGSLFTPFNTSAYSTRAIATPSTYFDGTPTPSRSKNAVTEDLSKDVFDLFQQSSVRIPNHIEQELRALLAKYAKTTEGYKRGRDLNRATIKAKEAKITELTYRIDTLEAELGAERALVKCLQWETQNNISDC